MNKNCRWEDFCICPNKDQVSDANVYVKFLSYLFSYFLTENRLLFHTVAPDHSFLFQLPKASLLPQILSYSVSFSEKNKIPREDKQTG